MAVAYYRFAYDKRQSLASALEEPRRRVEDYCAVHGLRPLDPGHAEVVRTREKERPEMAAALERCAASGAILIIGTSDRLRRDVTALAMLKMSGVEFLVLDDPTLDPDQLDGCLRTAQEQQRAHSEHVRAALAAVKTRGTWAKADGTPYKTGRRLGNPRGAEAFKGRNGAAAAVLARRKKADDFARRMRPVLMRLEAEGHIALSQIAERLNAEGHATARGGRWHASTVCALLARLERIR